ncbi:MAG: sugar kinase [Promethearchaeota archaeon]
MHPDVICMGEMLVEIMRDKIGVPHSVPGTYKGPYPSGAPAIFIDSAARMGSPIGISTGFIGVVGDDDFGSVITNKLRTDGVDVSQIRVDPDHTTGIAFVQYNKDGSRKFIFAAGAAAQLQEGDVHPDYFIEIKAFHVMGSALSISESSKNATIKAMNLAVEKGAIISFDPNLRPEMMPLEEILEICEPVVKQANILLPSGEEAKMLTGDDDAEKACENLLSMGPDIVVLKKAELGCSVFTKDDKIDVAGFKVNEIDPTGAGDSFGGAFIIEYLSNKSPEKAARFANAVGALKVTTFGPMAGHSRKEVERFIENAN